MANIQNIDPSTQTGFERHYLDDESADVFFKCKSNDGEVRVPAHKIVLSSKSPAFNAMFYGELREKGDLTITFTAVAFKQFLRFFYFNQHNLTMDSIREVVDLLKQYQMAHGLAVCAEFLQ